MRITKALKILIAVLFMMGLGTSVEARSSNQGHGGGSTGNPGVLPPFSSAFGQTYGEWSAEWWQWNYSLPTDTHPLFDTADCSEGQSSKVWFLGGTFTFITPDPDTVIGIAERECIIPTGKALFFPIINAECNTLEEGNENATEEELRLCANDTADHIQDLSVSIDGTELENLHRYRVESPFFTLGPLPDNNIAGVAEGTVAYSVADGFFIMLPPLSKGEHTIHFAGAAGFAVQDGDDFNFSFSLDITYYITVE